MIQKNEQCNEAGCSTSVERKDGNRCGGILFGTRDSVYGCGKFFCTKQHLVGHRGPYYCQPCWEKLKAAHASTVLRSGAKSRQGGLLIAHSNGTGTFLVDGGRWEVKTTAERELSVEYVPDGPLGGFIEVRKITYDDSVLLLPRRKAPGSSDH